jgi:hypothetical protein
VSSLVEWGEPNSSPGQVQRRGGRSRNLNEALKSP